MYVFKVKRSYPMDVGYDLFGCGALAPPKVRGGKHNAPAAVACGKSLDK